MAKYRINETALRRLINEAVRDAILEGQGLNKFKDMVNYANSRDMSDEDMTPHKDDLKDVGKWINRGTIDDDEYSRRSKIKGDRTYNPHYDEKGDAVYAPDNYDSDSENFGRKTTPVNQSAWGKAGRAAGISAGYGYAAGKKAYDKLSKRFGRRKPDYE